MPRFLLITLSMILLPFVLSGAMKRAVVVDSVSGSPLAKASVFGRSGKPVGISSDNGELPERIALSDYPLTVSSLGYAPATVEGPTDGLIKLREIAYDLPEVVVGPKKRQVLYMKGYVREYSMLTTYADTVFLFREKMVDFMIPARRTKGYDGWTTPRVLASKSYYHFSNDEGLDSVSNYFGQHFSWSDWVGVIDRAELPARLQGFDEAACDTVAGKYGPASIWRKDGENVSLDVDVLADTTGHGWAKSLAVYLRGKVDFSRFTLKYRFAEVNSGLILADNVAGMAINIESKGRGRDLPRFLHAGEEFDVDTYAEIFITDKRYM
ncbi:MAG: carboxypeptidase-like regulatory domain-containing protein, partial [Duncaniella sp.]|nr:carboxypeptidase-like regulatory domain-containing protein [Duncaniella sp.]